MSFNSNPEAKEKELRFRGVNKNDYILSDSKQFYASKDHVIQVANIISKQIDRKMLLEEITELQAFINRLDPFRYDTVDPDKLPNAIAADFVQNRLIGTQKLRDLVHTDGPATMNEYQKKELNQFTPDENQLKFAQFGDRRGNAVVDRDRIRGKRMPTEEQKNELFVETADALKSFFDANSIDNLFQRFRANWTNYFNINLPHQILQFDSRNRDLSKTNYSWSINPSGQIGQPGTIQIQDTLQQVIQMKIGPFWLPIYNPLITYYDTIRMAITEFSPQSVQVQEYLTTGIQVTPEFYHFEFQIKKMAGNKVYLVPVNDTFTFRKSFSQITAITVIFRYPFNILAVQKDYGTYTMTYGVVTTLTTTANTNLSTGDLIYIMNSNSGSVIIDQQLMNSSGYIVTMLSPTSFTINVNTSSLIGSQSNITVYYGSKRFTFEIEFVSLEQ